MQRIHEDIHENENNWVCAISGRPGFGKSFSAITLALSLYPSFTEMHVAFSEEEFLKLVDELPEGSIIVADEIAEWFSSRSFMKSENRDISTIFQIFRLCRFGVIATLPEMRQGDKDLRTMSNAYIQTLKKHKSINKVECKYFEVEMDSIRGKKPITKYPIIRGEDGYKKKIKRVFIDRMPKALEKKYMKRKREFTKRIIKEKREAARLRREKKDENVNEHNNNETCPRCKKGWYCAGKSIFRKCSECGFQYTKKKK